MERPRRGGGNPPVQARVTLPPPEWSKTSGSIKPKSDAPSPVSHQTGARADEAALRVRVEEARASSEPEAERIASVELARWLAARDRELDEAAQLALRAVRIQDDPELRVELAGWLESLGEAGLAAAMLRPTMPDDDDAAEHEDDPLAARRLVRVGVLHARAGDAAGASEALEDAAKADRTAAIPLELRGTLASWAPEIVSASSAADAYVESAVRRAAIGEDSLEDLLRAFEADPSSENAATALATALGARGKGLAADEVTREHGAALTKVDVASGKAVHARRRSEALAVGDVARALGAAFDEGLDAVLLGEEATALNELLVRAGLLEPLAARLEAAAERAEKIDKGRLYETLARLSGGPLAQPSRAAHAYAALLPHKPASEEARAALLALASDVGDPSKLASAIDARDWDALRARVRDHFRGKGAFGPGLDAETESRLERANDERANGSYAEANEVTRELATKSSRLASLAWTHAVLAGDAKAAGIAIERVAADASPNVRPLLLAVAAERLEAGGDHAGARRVAELASQADPSSPRAITTLATACASLGAMDRASASALERAITVVCPRGSWCASLARALEELGEAGYAVAWTQQQVALRPGDRDALKALVDRVVRAKDASRLGDSLTWILSQPQPAAPLAELVASGLRALAELDPDRAAIVARRALDTFGPRKEALRLAILEAAERAKDETLAVAATERWISAGATAGERREAFVMLAERYARLGHEEGTARAIVRAFREGADVGALAPRIEILDDLPDNGDGQLAVLEARASLLATRDDPAPAAQAWRDLGAALWDLAEDKRGAVRAWVRAARLVPQGGYYRLAVDMARFADPDFALTCLTDLVLHEENRVRSGAIAAEAARAALAVNQPWRAFELAALALARSPEHATALETAERGALACGRATDMSSLYDAMSDRALGRYGRRAAHYRGARFFEQHGDAKLALKHAADAFSAVPSEGATFILLARTAERASDLLLAVRTVEHVADAARSRTARSAWLLRAAQIAGPGEEGARHRVDILLRAALLEPAIGTLSLLGDATRELLGHAPEEADALALRVANASRMLTAKIEGPDGARVALALSTLSLDLFHDGDGALAALARAFDADADLDEYDRIHPHARSLAQSPNIDGFLSRAIALIERPYSNVGVPALELLRRIAVARDDSPLADRLAIYAAEKDPDDPTRVRAADEAAIRLADPVLTARLDKKSPPDERAEVMRVAARELSLAGEHDAALAHLARATELLPADRRGELDADLKAIYEAAGRGEDLEQRALRDAKNEDILPQERANHWAEVAQLREERSDFEGAAGALQEAARLDAEPLSRWSALERAAELAGTNDLRIVALKEIEVRVAEDARPAVLRRLARAHEDQGDFGTAIATLEKVLTIVPDDDESDRVLEGLVVSGGDFEKLAEHLGWRASRLARMSEQRDALRAVRLRRAALLEQRLGRVEEACAELETLLDEWPDNESALRYLADLYERSGQMERAAPLWQHLSELAHGPETQNDLELRAIVLLRDSGEAEKALGLLKELLARDPHHERAMALRLEMARASGDDAELGESLAALAETADDPRAASEMLVEAAQAAARVGDAVRSLAWAQRAASNDPARVSTQLFARGLEYRTRGAGTLEEARATIDELGKIEGALEAEDEALRTFLTAEALTVLGRTDEALKVLGAAYATVGAQPLVALGMGERLYANTDFSGALPLLQAALAGNLLGFRSRGVVALSAADAAIRGDRPALALELLEEATFDSETRPTALKRTAQLAASLGDTVRSRAVLLELARSAGPEDRALTLAQLGRLLCASRDPADQQEGERAFLEAIAAAPEGSILNAQLVAELETLKHRSLPPAPLMEGSTETMRDPAPPVEVLHKTSLAELESAIGEATSQADRIRARRVLARAHAERGARDSAEAVLWEAVAEGSLEAGDELANLLEGSSARTSDLLRIRRTQADLAPGDLTRLEALRSAALGDHNTQYARAVEHVARALDAGAGPLPPPGLVVQVEQPGMLALLAHPEIPGSAFLDALAIVWEGAAKLFIRDAASYGISGIEHVTPGGASPVSRLYEVAMRLLEAPKIPLYVRRAIGDPVPSVALLSPAAAILSGDASDETGQLRFALGQALASALPQNVLVMGLADREARVMWRAMLGAFGPPELGRQLDVPSARLAESFWQTLSSKSQRRLQELLRSAPTQEFDAIAEAVHQSARRVGLFVSGDFGLAVRTYLAEEGHDVAQLVQDEGLEGLCVRFPVIADLHRLAVSPDYADARWHPMPVQAPNGPPSTGRFRFSRPV